NMPAAYGVSGGTGRPSAPTTRPSANRASTAPGPAESRSARWSRTVAQRSPAGSRTRTGSTPSRCGRGAGGIRRLRLTAASVRGAGRCAAAQPGCRARGRGSGSRAVRAVRGVVAGGPLHPGLRLVARDALGAGVLADRDLHVTGQVAPRPPGGLPGGGLLAAPLGPGGRAEG